MQRIECPPRQDWKRKLEDHGFSFHSADGEYWNEAACYCFGAAEIDEIEAATQSLHALCMDAVDRIVRSGNYAPFGLTYEACSWIEHSWQQREPHLYCRFDLACDGAGSIKLLEANADTPTALIEAALSQWFWMQELHPEADQFNSIHEKLIARWPQVVPNTSDSPLYLSAMRGQIEDNATLTYLQDCAVQAGLRTARIDIADIGWATALRQFVDMKAQPIQRLFKLYPSEWLLSDRFSHHLARSSLQLIEPPWKLLLSCKAILPLLWEYFPDHPNLLPAFAGEPPARGRWARKPLFSREGANIALFDSGAPYCETGGAYGAGPFISQAVAPLFESGGRHAVIGSWVIGDEAAGIGIREDRSPITQNRSQFVPHYFM